MLLEPALKMLSEQHHGGLVVKHERLSDGRKPRLRPVWHGCARGRHRQDGPRFSDRKSRNHPVECCGPLYLQRERQGEVVHRGLRTGERVRDDVMGGF
jgi:hypothetical protein